MDKYEYKVRADEIRELISQRQYGKAAELADTIDWSRVKKSAILCTISDLYKKNRRYDDAIELLQLAYEKNPGGKDILYSLCELYIKTNNIINTVSTYKDFLKVASNDPRRYILQYKIYEMEDVTLEERIEVLEELKSRDYRDKWAYTLAYLYHRAGLATKCVEECDELILWFDEGKYVYMAMELKMRHQPLTPAQQEKYDHRFDAMNGVPYQSQLPAEETADQAADTQTTDDQKAVSQNTQPLTAVTGNTAPISDAEKAALAGQTVVYNPVQDKNGDSVMVPNGNTVVVGGSKGAVSSAEAIALSMGYTQVYHGMEPEPEIQVKQVDVGEYNTINLQAALAEGVAEVLEKNDGQGSSVENIIKADTKEIYPVENTEAPSESDKYVNQAVTDKTVVIAQVSGTFDATKTIPMHDIQKTINAMDGEKVAEAAPIPVPVPAESEAASVATPDTAVYTGNTIPLYSNEQIINSITMPRSNIGPTKVVYPEAVSPIVTEAMSAQPPERFAEVMTQEPDGQLSLVMPEDRVKVVSQITGQLSINDVMTEWNRLKYEREELNRKKYHELVQQQSGVIFNEFEKAALNGVLETLEKENEEAEKAKEAAEEAKNPKKSDGPVQKLAFEHVDMESADEAVDGEAEPVSTDTVQYGPIDEAMLQQYVEETKAAEEVVAAGVAEVMAAETIVEVAATVDEAIEEPADVVEESVEETIEESVTSVDEIVEETADAAEEIVDDTFDDIAKSVDDAIEEAGETVEVEEAVAEEAAEVIETEEAVAETAEKAEDAEIAVAEATEAENDAEDAAEDTQESFKKNIGDIFDKIESDSSEDDEDISAIWGNKSVAEDETGKLPDVATIDELVEKAEVDAEESDETDAEDFGAGESENDNETDSAEESDDAEEDDSDEDIDPREKTYHVIGMNETTNHYINKKKKKLEAKAAELEAEKEDNDEDDDSDDVRELTSEEKELFGSYVQSKDSRKQLINVIDNVSMASYTGNIIITGGDGSDVSNLATVIMKDIKQTDSNFSGKVARVPAKSLNNKRMDSVVKQLANGALIIENASAMSDETAASLYKCLDTENLGIIITMLDSERNMEKLLNRAPRLSPLFTARMNVKPLTKEQLADYAVKYAYEREFSIDQMGMLGLHRQIEARQTATHSVNFEEVKEIVDEAIAHVSKKTLGHFFDILGGKRYDSEDMIILGEKDFR